MRTSIKVLSILAGLVLISSCGKKSDEIKPVRKNITETVFASGVLVPDDQYDLTAQSEGYLVKLNFNEGDAVKTGAILAVIDNKQNDYSARSAHELLSIASTNVKPDAPALLQAKANLELAKEKLRQDEIQAERYKKLYETNSVSKLEYENAMLALDNSKTNLTAMQENYNLVKQQAEQQLIIQQSQTGINSFLQGMNEVKAVVGGKVYKKFKQLGDYVRRGDVIAEIGDKNSIYAKLSIDETNISKIKLNQQVIIQLNTNKERNYKGVVSEIYPAFDEQSQSFYCKARFTDDLDFKVAGTQLQANIIIGNKANVLTIPRNYLGYGNKVTVKGKGVVTVTTGFVSSDWVEIDHGLDENSTILMDKK
jgi:multidrug efflux pump subunit AcrA (membrane-fusion protein)